MTRPVRLGEFASAELADAVRWYEMQRPGLGADLLGAVDGTLRRIQERPEIGAEIGGDACTRRIMIKRFPYQVVYRLARKEIVVAAFAHLKRRPGYWKSRL